MGPCSQVNTEEDFLAEIFNYERTSDSKHIVSARRFLQEQSMHRWCILLRFLKGALYVDGYQFMHESDIAAFANNRQEHLVIK